MEDNVNKPVIEDPKTKQNCKMCGYGYGRGHFSFRILLAVIILLVVFWLVTIVGRFHSGYGRNYGSRFMGGNTMRNYPMSRYPAGMMPGATGRMMPQTATSTPAK